MLVFWSLSLDLVFLVGTSTFGGVYFGVSVLIRIEGILSDNGWGGVSALLIVRHTVSSTVGCWSLGECGSWHWEGNLWEIFFIWYYVELSGLLWSSVLNLPLPPQMHNTDSWREHQETFIITGQNKWERKGKETKNEDKIKQNNVKLNKVMLLIWKIFTKRKF